MRILQYHHRPLASRGLSMSGEGKKRVTKKSPKSENDYVATTRPVDHSTFLPQLLKEGGKKE